MKMVINFEIYCTSWDLIFFPMGTFIDRAGTEGCFNVQITLYIRYERSRNVETTLCVSWDRGVHR